MNPVKIDHIYFIEYFTLKAVFKKIERKFLPLLESEAFMQINKSKSNV